MKQLLNLTTDTGFNCRNLISTLTGKRNNAISHYLKNAGILLLTLFLVTTTANFNTADAREIKQAASRGGGCEEPAYFGYTNTELCAPCTFLFTPYLPNAVSHHWDFGDGNTSTEVSPTHTYSVSGNYDVIHTVVTIGYDGGLVVSTCRLTLTAACGSSAQVVVFIECGQLKIKAASCETGSVNCQHQWELLNAGGAVCETQFTETALFDLDNFNTYDNPSVTLRHTLTCAGQLPVVTNYTHTFTDSEKGIFVNINAPSAGSDLLSQVGNASCINNGQVLFGMDDFNDRQIYITGILKTDVVVGTFTACDFHMFEAAGIDVIKLTTFQNCTFKNSCDNAWRGIQIYSNGSVTMQMNFCTVRGAIYGVNPIANAQANLVHDNFYQNFIGILHTGTGSSDFKPTIRGCNFASGASIPGKGSNDISEVSDVTGGYSTSLGFAGIFIRGARFAPSSSTENNCNVLANGLYLLNSTASSLKDWTFSNCEAIGAYPLAPEGNGIYFEDNGGTSLGTLSVFGSFFYTNQYGVRAVSRGSGTIVSLNENTTGNNWNSIVLEQQTGGSFTSSVISNNKLDSKTIGIGYICLGANLPSNITIHSNYNEYGFLVAYSMVKGGDGILLQGPAAAGSNIEVYNNTLILYWQGGDSGIHLDNYSGANIHDNTITLPVFNGDANLGIWLENSHQNSLTNNKVTGGYCTTCWNIDGAGIGLLAENSPGNVIEKNVFLKIGRGFEFVGDCTSPGNLRCNTLSQTGYGMQFGRDETAPVGVIGQQSNTGNLWDDPGFLPGNDLIGAVNYGSQTELDMSVFESAQGSGTNEYPQSFQLQPGLDPDTWFKPGTEVGCASPAMRPEGGADRASKESTETSVPFALAPNPVSDFLKISFANPVEMYSGELELVNLNGTIVYRLKFNEVNDLNIPVDALPAGIYVCRISCVKQAPMHQLFNIVR